MNLSGETEELDEKRIKHILETKIIEKYSKEGLRTFMYAYKDIDSDYWETLQAENNNFANEEDRGIVEEDLQMLATFALEDDLRDGVQTSIENLSKAKIRVRMISGDNLETARQAALKAKIITSQE